MDLNQKSLQRLVNNFGYLNLKPKPLQTKQDKFGGRERLKIKSPISLPKLEHNRFLLKNPHRSKLNKKTAYPSKNKLV